MFNGLRWHDFAISRATRVRLGMRFGADGPSVRWTVSRLKIGVPPPTAVFPFASICPFCLLCGFVYSMDVNVWRRDAADTRSRDGRATFE